MEKRSILIADDEINLCRILDAELKKAGYSVTAVHDGAQAVEQARCIEFEVIILDVRMPVLDGLSALREIRKVSKDIPVIMMTAYESHDTMASALSMGATACVHKPFDLESLVALVKATLHERNGSSDLNWTGLVRTVLFNRNQPVIMEVHDGANVGRYESRIVDKDDQNLTVICGCNRSEYLSIGVGTPVSIGFAGEDAFYSFESSVLANRGTNPPSMLIGKPAVIYRIQRRKHPRMIANVPVDIRLIENSESNPDAGPVVRVITSDLGPGGMKILSEDRVPKGTEISIEAVDIDRSGWFKARGKVTRERKLEDITPGWEHGIQFTKLDDESRCVLQGMVITGDLV